jgi:hypothetical protein
MKTLFPRISLAILFASFLSSCGNQNEFDEYSVQSFHYTTYEDEIKETQEAGWQLINMGGTWESETDFTSGITPTIDMQMPKQGKYYYFLFGR